MNLKLITIFTIAALQGCATTYTPPADISQKKKQMPIVATDDQLLQATKIALINDGYQISFVDDKSGIISAKPKNFKLNKTQANCGSTMGLNYLDDNRTTSKVGWNVIAKANMVQAAAIIESEYRPGAVEQNITLTCVSSGQLEDMMLKKIVSNVR